MFMVNSWQLNANSLLGPVQSQQLTVNCQQLAVDGPPELMQMSTDGHIYIYIYILGSAVVDGPLGPDRSVTDA